jgi:hypothetical protein
MMDAGEKIRGGLSIAIEDAQSRAVQLPAVGLSHGEHRRRRRGGERWGGWNCLGVGLRGNEGKGDRGRGRPVVMGLHAECFRT